MWAGGPSRALDEALIAAVGLGLLLVRASRYSWFSYGLTTQHSSVQAGPIWVAPFLTMSSCVARI